VNVVSRGFCELSPELYSGSILEGDMVVFDFTVNFVTGEQLAKGMI